MNNDDADVARDEQRALRWAALAALVMIAWLMSPIAMGMLLGALMALSRVTSRAGISAGDLEARARALIEGAVTRAASLAEAVASTTASTALALFFLLLTMYFILRRWQPVSRAAQETLPLRPNYTLKLFEEFRIVGRTTLLGTVLTGVVQGALRRASEGTYGLRGGRAAPHAFSTASALALRPPKP